MKNSSAQINNKISAVKLFLLAVVCGWTAMIFIFGCSVDMPQENQRIILNPGRGQVGFVVYNKINDQEIIRASIISLPANITNCQQLVQYLNEVGEIESLEIKEASYTASDGVRKTGKLLTKINGVCQQDTHGFNIEINSVMPEKPIDQMPIREGDVIKLIFN